MLTLGSKLNRCYDIHLPFSGTYIDVGIFFNKTNTYIGFNTDRKIGNMIKEGSVKTNIYKDLRQSSFASNFLDIRDTRTPNLDVRCQFNNIQKPFKEKIHYVANETIKLAKIESANKKFESCLYVYVFGFSDYEGDFLYFLAERQHIDVPTNKKLVRTSALQISTTECIENLNNMVEYYNGTSEKHLNITDEQIDNDLKSIFDKPTISVRKI